MATGKEQREVTLVARLRDTLTVGLERLRKSLRGVQSDGDKTVRSGTLLGRSFRLVESAAKGLISRLARVARGLGSVIFKITPLRAALVALSGAFAIKKLAEYQDTWLRVENRLAVVVKDVKQLADAQRQIFAIAQRTRQPIEAIAELYSRLALSAGNSAKETERMLHITELVSKAAQIGGGSNASVEAALIQFSQIVAVQGTASGIGQELRSIREQAPYLFVQIAEGLNMTTGELRKAAEEQRLTSEDILAALEKQGGVIEDRFGKINITLGQVGTKLQNAMIKLVGVFGSETGLARSLVNAIDDVAETINEAAAKVARYAKAVVETFRAGLFPGDNTSPEQTAAARKSLAALKDSLVGFISQAARSGGTIFVSVLREGLMPIFISAGYALADIVRDQLREILPSAIAPSPSQSRLALESAFKETRTFKRDGEDVSVEFVPKSIRDEPTRYLLERLRILKSEYEKTIEFASDSDSISDQIAVNAARKGLDEINAVFRKMSQENEQRVAVTMAVMSSGWKQLGEVVESEKENMLDAGGQVSDALESLRQKAIETGIIADPAAGGPGLFRRAMGFVSGGLDRIKNQVDQVKSAYELFNEFSGKISDELIAAGVLEADRMKVFEKYSKDAEKQLNTFEQSLKASRVEGIYFSLAMKAASAAMDRLVESRKALYDISIVEKSYSRAKKDFGGELDLINTQKELGVLGSADAWERTKIEVDAYRESLTQAKARLVEIGQQTGNMKLVAEALREINREELNLRLLEKKLDPNRFWGNFRDGIRDVVSELNTLSKLGEQVGRTIASGLGDGISNALADVIDGTKSATQAFREMASSILRDIGQMIIKMLVFRALGGIFGFGAPALALGFSRGGAVPGSGRGDTVPARLEPGEFVLNRSMVAAFGGTRRLEAARQAMSGTAGAAGRALGRFMTGGPVEGGGMTPVPVMVTDRAGMDNLMSGGLGERITRAILAGEFGLGDAVRKAGR